MGFDSGLDDVLEQSLEQLRTRTRFVARSVAAVATDIDEAFRMVEGRLAGRGDDDVARELDRLGVADLFRSCAEMQSALKKATGSIA